MADAPREAPTVAALITPRTGGAIATIAVDGPRALEVADRLFRPASGAPLAARKRADLVLGRWASGEELIVSVRSASCVRVHCHGGAAAPAAILAQLADEGCPTVDARAWLLASEPDPLVAQAAIALAEARTLRTAAILLDQYHGALRVALEHLAACLGADELDAAQAVLGRLLEWRRLRFHLTRPWRVVIAGPPNVGKSTLLNALLGYQRTIVHDTPGTTRDVVTAATAVDGWPIELADTAGLHEARSDLERSGIELAIRRAAEADLVLWVEDASRASGAARAEREELSTPDHEPALSGGHAERLLVLNKCDLLHPAPITAEAQMVSALTGEGLENLVAAIARRLVPVAPPQGEAVPFTAEQIALLETVDELARRGRWQDAALRIGEFLGRRADPAAADEPAREQVASS